MELHGAPRRRDARHDRSRSGGGLERSLMLCFTGMTHEAVTSSRTRPPASRRPTRTRSPACERRRSSPPRSGTRSSRATSRRSARSSPRPRGEEGHVGRHLQRAHRGAARRRARGARSAAARRRGRGRHLLLFCRGDARDQVRTRMADWARGPRTSAFEPADEHLARPRLSAGAGSAPAVLPDHLLAPSRRCVCAVCRASAPGEPPSTPGGFCHASPRARCSHAAPGAGSHW